jgi:AcrR family transcriptional regulator
MSTSAIPANRRERKMQETSAHLTSVCRRLTAEHGLSGFTIDEACTAVDISRRTFFNYFPSKEDAILGADPDQELEWFTTEFLSRGSRGWGAVLDDFIDLIIKHFDAAGVDSTARAEFLQAAEREPRLWLSFMGLTRDRERQMIGLIALREGVSLDDERAEAAVNVVSTLIRSAGDKVLSPDSPPDFSTAVLDSLGALRTVLTPIDRKVHS